MQGTHQAAATEFGEEILALHAVHGNFGWLPWLAHGSFHPDASQGWITSPNPSPTMIWNDRLRAKRGRNERAVGSPTPPSKKTQRLVPFVSFYL